MEEALLIERLRRTEEELRHWQKIGAIGRLTVGVAHDVNNLLSAITGYAELLQAALGENPHRREAEEIVKAARRAASLTRHLLALSRKEPGDPGVIDLNAVVADIGGLLRRLIGEDIELVTVLDAKSLLVKVDQGRIGQVIVNLAVNARDAMPKGGKLTIETADADGDEEYAPTHPQRSARPYVALAVTDTGCGIEAEARPQLFEPFFTTKAIDKGTGLGLSTVYDIVREAGGTIWVYTEIGRGTTFKICLPKAEAPVASCNPDREREPLPRGSETVLVVEDDENCRAVASKLLRHGGYAVLEARDAREALLVSSRHPSPIDLLITDMVMPQASGGDLAGRIARLRPDMKVLFMSGYPVEAVAPPGMAGRDAPFLPKPFTPETLGRKVREALARPPREGPRGESPPWRVLTATAPSPPPPDSPPPPLAEPTGS